MANDIPCSATCNTPRPCDRKCDSTFLRQIIWRRHFPTAVRFLDITLREQITKVRCEVLELALAYARHQGDYKPHGVAGDPVEHIAEEAWDVIHAAETLLAMLTERGVDVDEIRTQVEAKNRDRGYYEAGDQS